MDNVCIVKQLKSVFQHMVTINEEKKQKQKIVEINKKKRLFSQGRDYTHCQYQVTKN